MLLASLAALLLAKDEQTGAILPIRKPERKGLLADAGFPRKTARMLAAWDALVLRKEGRFNPSDEKTFAKKSLLDKFKGNEV